MKNVGHIAAKNVLILAIASIVYYLVGFGIAFGDGGNGIVGGSGFVARRSTSCSRSARRRSRGSAPSPPRPATCSRSSSPRSRWRSSGARWRSVRSSGCTSPSGRLHAHLLRRLALDLEPGRLAVRQGHAGLRRLDGRPLSGSARRAGRGDPARAAAREVRPDGKPNAIPGHNMAFTTLGVIILWFGWFGFNPGSTLSGRLRRRRLLRVRRPEHEPRRGGRRARCRRHVVARGQEARPLDDAERRHRGARRDHGGMRVRRALGGDRDRLRRPASSSSSASLLVERVGIDDPVGAIAAHGMSGVWGTLALGFLDRAGAGREARDRQGGLFYGGGLHQLGDPGARARSPSARSRSRPRSSCCCCSRSRSGSAPSPRSSRWAWTSPSTACGAIPSSTSRFRAGTARM